MTTPTALTKDQFDKACENYRRGENKVVYAANCRQCYGTGKYTETSSHNGDEYEAECRLCTEHQRHRIAKARHDLGAFLVENSHEILRGLADRNGWNCEL